MKTNKINVVLSLNKTVVGNYDNWNNDLIGVNSNKCAKPKTTDGGGDTKTTGGGGGCSLNSTDLCGLLFSRWSGCCP